MLEDSNAFGVRKSKLLVVLDDETKEKGVSGIFISFLCADISKSGKISVIEIFAVGLGP